MGKQIRCGTQPVGYMYMTSPEISSVDCAEGNRGRGAAISIAEGRHGNFDLVRYCACSIVMQRSLGCSGKGKNLLLF